MKIFTKILKVSEEIKSLLIIADVNGGRKGLKKISIDSLRDLLRKCVSMGKITSKVELLVLELLQRKYGNIVQ